MLVKSQGKSKFLLKNITEEIIEQKAKYTGLRKNLIRQYQQLIDDTLKGTATLDKEELFKVCLPSFLKSQKQKDLRDIALISLYLVQMKKFMKLFGDNFTSITDIDSFEQLKKISSTIIYEKFNRNRIIVKFGDEGKKFFLILKGEVQVILPTKKTSSMLHKEFKRYLLLLYIYKEYEILKLVIKDNKVNQMNAMFNASYYFFKEENVNINNNMNNVNITSSNINSNIDNSINVNNKEEENKTNNIYGYRDYKFGFNRIENTKSFTNMNNENNNSEKNKFKEAKRTKFLKKLMQYYLTEDEISYYERTKDINLKEEDDGIKVIPMDYINRINDYSTINLNYRAKLDDNEDSKLFMNDDLRYNYFIYEYKKLIELQTGDIFGDLALTGNNIKRTATILSTDECHFACLTRELYSAFIEKGNERVRNNKINYLCSINILKSFPRFILEKKLFNHFAFKNFIKDKYLLRAKEINNDIIFLKDGIFEVSFSGKLNDLSDLINLFYSEYINLANKKEKDELDQNIINNVKLMEYQKNKINIIFQRFVGEEFSYVLFLVNAPSIFGLRETETKIPKIIINEKKKTKEKIYLYHSNICVKCHSSKGEYIYIDKNIFYKHIYGTDSVVQDETKVYVLDFLRKIMRRLLNIRYIKLWNLFLSIGIDKNLNSNINLEKIQKNEDIYNAVNKLLAILKEGQLYSNEISKYMNNYFENLRNMTINQKQLIKIVNQNYESEKFKKIIGTKRNNDKKLEKNNTYNTNKFRINSTSTYYMMNTNINNSNNKEIEKNSDTNYFKRFLEIRKEKNKNKSLIDLKAEKVKLKPRKVVRSSSAGTDTYTNPNNRVKMHNKFSKNNNIRNWYSRHNKKEHIIKRASSGYSYLNRLSNSSTPRLDNITRGENSKPNELTFLKNNFNKNYFKKFAVSSNRPNTSKSLYYANYFNYSKMSKEKYVKERINYIIRNTRILFTKRKNLDNIVRIKRINSVG